jgi:SAM-dependent methyltransferase
MDKLQKQWDDLSKNEAYYAVLTYDEFRADKLTDNVIDRFFETGEEHVAKLWEEIETHFVKDFRPRHALDFGCGVGRLVVSLSKRSNEVTGVDISRQMLEESQRNCDSRGIGNTRFLETGELMAGKNEFDFIHSFIVFQHIKPKIGEQIVRKLVEDLAEGGIGALHLTYFDPLDPPDSFQNLRARIYRDIPFANTLKNLLKGGKTAPLIRMYSYDMKRIFAILQENDCHKCLVRFTHHGVKGAFLIFQKSADLRYQF